MSRTDAATILAVVEAGITAVVDGVPTGEPGATTACDGWTALDLTRHVEAVAGAVLLWTGSALGGRVARMRVGADLHRYNDLMLRRLPPLGMAEHAHRYQALATDHVRLARATWAMPMMETPDGTVLDVGGHARLVAVEWHVHAWDLARARGRDHVPTEDAVACLVDAWDDVLAEVTGRERQGPGTGWTTLLRAAGRTP